VDISRSPCLSHIFPRNENQGVVLQWNVGTLAVELEPLGTLVHDVVRNLRLHLFNGQIMLWLKSCEDLLTDKWMVSAHEGGTLPEFSFKTSFGWFQGHTVVMGDIGITRERIIIAT